jgi:GT2 family glycosyltransferase
MQPLADPVRSLGTGLSHHAHWSWCDASGWDGPARVMVVDVDRPIDDVSCVHPAGRYQAVWVFATRAGAPLGLVTMPVTSDVLAGTAIARQVDAELGPAQAVAGSEGRPDRDMALPSISIVIPTNLARPDELLGCLASLSLLQYPDFDIVVIDNRSHAAVFAAPADAVRAVPGVRVVHEPRPGISAARNAGVAAATGDVIVFTDDDVVADPRWLLGIGRRFAAEPDVDAVSGLVLPAELETPAQMLFEQSGNGPDRSYQPLTFTMAAPTTALGRLLGSDFTVTRREGRCTDDRVNSLYAMGEYGTGSNMAFRADALRRLGPFDVALGVGTATCGGEDLSMFVRVLMSGRSLGYEPTAITHHIHRRTIKELERQTYGYGVGFTALLCSLARDDWRHAAGVLRRLLPAVRSIASPTGAKNAKRTTGYPRQLARLELKGLVCGPLAYLWAQRTQRRWSM